MNRSLLSAAFLAVLAMSALAAEVGKPAPDFKLVDLEGTTHQLADFAGRTVVLEWINPECPYCVRVYETGLVASTLTELAKIDRDAAYLAVESSTFGKAGQLDAKQVGERARTFLDAHGIDVPVLIDHDGAAGRAYAAATTPHIFVIDGKGVLRYQGGYTSDPKGEDPAAINYVLTTVKSLASGAAVEPTETKPWGCSIKYAKDSAPKATTEAAAAPAVATIGQPAPEFTATDLSGKTHKLSDYRGKLVVLEWFNPGCPYCRKVYENGLVASTIAGLKEISPDSVYLAINSTAKAGPGEFTRDDLIATSKAHLEKNNIELPVLVDHDGTIGHAYAAKTTPHMYVIDAQGVLRYAGAFTDDAEGARPDATNYVLNAAAAIAAGKPVEPTETKPWGCSVKYATPQR